MQVALVAITLAHNFSRIDNLILRGHATSDNTRREKHPLHLPGPTQCIQTASQFIRAKGKPLHLTASGTERAVVTVALAGRGHHCLQDWLLPLRGRHICYALGQTPRLTGQARALLQRLISSRLKNRRFCHPSKLCHCISFFTASLPIGTVQLCSEITTALHDTCHPCHQLHRRSSV